MDTLIRIEQNLARFLEWILVGLFATFLFLVCVLVMLRYGFSSSILGGNEFVTIAFLYTSAIGGAVCIAKREHIAITFIVDMLPEGIKRWTHSIGLALIAVVNAYMVSLSITWIEKTGHFPWQPLGWPQGIVQASIPLGCGLAIVYCVIKIILTLGGRERVDILWLPED